jgi:hypothetical protein
MISIPDTLRHEYQALKTLRIMVESETKSAPVGVMNEQSNALDHLMRATDEDGEQQLQQARAHFIRAGRDLYFYLLTSRLDRLEAMSAFLPSEELDRFRKEHQRIWNSVQSARAEPESIPSLADYVASLEEIDAFLASYVGLESEVAAKRQLQRDRYKNVLIVILSALVGAVTSLLIGALMK